MPEPEHTTNVTLGELMSGPAPQEDPTLVTAPASARRGIESEPAPSNATQFEVSDDDSMLEDDDYLLDPPRRFNRLTIVLVVALIFLCGFIVGVLAAKVTTGHPRSSAESSLVSTVGPAAAAGRI
jgi:hypothetical protein